MRIVYTVHVLIYEMYHRFSQYIIKKFDIKSKKINVINNSFEELERKKWSYYKKLIKKYPEMKSVKKYLKSGRVIAVKGIVALHMKAKTGVNTIWTYQASYEDLNLILSCGVRVVSEIYLKNGSPHNIIINAIKKKGSEIVFSDSLGNYNSNYKFAYNEKCYLEKDEFLSINTGNPVFLSISLPNGDVYRHISRIIRKYNYYEID